MSLPIVGLPRLMHQRPDRPVQPEIPATKAERDKILSTIRSYLDTEDGSRLVPPMPLDELREEALTFCDRYGFDPAHKEFIALLINNELWRDSLATIPFERRLLLLPKCMRVEDKCPAPFDELGLLCKKCGLCSIEDLQEEAEKMGYAVLVAEGSPIVMAIIETGQIEAIVGVSCLNVLEKVYSYMEAAAIPGIALPLLQDDCIDTNVDLDWVWDSVHLTSDDKTRRLDLGGMRETVDTWFQPENLVEIMGEPKTETERLGQAWLSEGGKRWRPFLTVALNQALQAEPEAMEELSIDLKKAAVAVECFHKASLIHDDIEDDDDERYGKETLHHRHGMPVALNLGDFLLGEGYRLLAECDVPAANRAEMLRLAADGHRALSVGQGEELLWSRDPKALKPAEVVSILRGKTVPAFSTALRIGAAFAGAEEDMHLTLDAFSDAMGIAYQIRDDLDDFYAAKNAGKAPETRPTIVWALAHDTAKKDQKKIVADAWMQSGEPEAIYELLAALGAEERSNELLQAYKDEAIRSLRRLDSANVKGLLRRVMGKIFDELVIEGWCSEHETRNVAGGEIVTAAAG